MLKIHKALEYALVSLNHMLGGTPGELTSAKQLAQLYGLPFHMTSHVLQKMAQGGILRSEQGAMGGYQIIRDLGRVNFLELLEMLHGPVEIASCIQKDTSCCDIGQTCTIIAPIAALNARLLDFYRTFTVKDLLAELPKHIRRSALPAKGKKKAAGAGVEAGEPTA